jgi:hypothetical protein
MKHRLSFQLQHRHLNGENLQELTVQELQKLEAILKRSLSSVSKIKVCAPTLIYAQFISDEGFNLTFLINIQY